MQELLLKAIAKHIDLSGKQKAGILQELNQYAIILWNVDDILMVARNIGKDVTEDEALEALESIQDDHDADVGITWDTIEYYLSS